MFKKTFQLIQSNEGKDSQYEEGEVTPKLESSKAEYKKMGGSNERGDKGESQQRRQYGS